MSLRIWLPLDGDLTQQGTSEITVVNNGATVNTNGKIGSCYAFNGSTGYIALSGSDLFKIFTGGTQQFSITMWVFHADTTRAILFGDYATSGGIGFNIELSTSHAVRFYWNGSPDTYPANAIVTASGWTHVALTYNGTKLQSYINGVEKGSWSGTLAVKNKTSGEFRLGRDNRSDSTAFNGRMNDFRIYDHCLSAAEVREIAQGLVLHYKLNGGVFGNPNLYTGSEKFTGSWNGISGWTTSSETYQNFVVKQRSSTWGGLSQNIPCIQGDIFTISFYGKVDSGGTIRSIHRSNLGNVTTGLTILDGNFMVMGDYWIRTTDDGTQWKRYWATVQITGSDVTYLQWRLENSVADKNFYICGIKLEKGNAATPWCPADSELLIDRTIVEDSSGYNYNGTITGTSTMSSNTARYSSVLYFGAYQTPLITLNNPSFLSTLTNCSISWWEYITVTTNSLPFVGQSGSYYIGAGSATTKLYHCHVGSAAKLYRNGIIESSQTFNSSNQALTSGSYTHTQNQWVHFTLSGADLSSWTAFKINGYSTGWPINGYISDVRIYNTALTADDILALYHTGAKVDNLGRFHSYELLENTGFKIHKTGVASHKLFIEPGYLNNITSVSYKPTANIDNSCVAGAIVDFTQFAQSELPLNIVAEYDVNWSNLTVGTGGNLAVTIQGNNREIASNSWKWSGTNYVTQGGITISAASGTTHVKKISTIPASWLNTYNGSHLGIRCNYSNGNGTISLTNIKVTVEQNKCKVKKEYIEADEFIEL